MDKLLKIGTVIFSVLAVAACLSTVGIVGYALVGGVPDKSPEEVYQAEMQARNEETQDIHVLNEANPTSSGTQTPLYDEHIHNYTESMDVKANCYREGRLKYTCDTCGDIYYIDVAMTGHRPDDEWTVTREATPDLVGLRVKYCIYCDQIVAIEDIPYTSEENSIGNENHIHNYTSTIEREPTCILAGLRKYTCSCGSSYTEPIHAPGHVASDWEVAAEATTTHKGTEQRMCRVCGVLLDSRPIEAKRESPNPTESPANTASPTQTPTRTPEQASTPTPTNTPMPTNVPTQRPIVTSSPVNTPRPTAAPTARPTNTPTAIPTNIPTPPKEESREIYRDENVIISYTGITGDENDYDVNFIVENLSNRTITVQVRETSINGVMVNPICSIEVAPGKKAFDDMQIIGKDATNTPKSRVTNIETKFRVFDFKDNGFGYDTENVVILPYNATNDPSPTVKPTSTPTARPTNTPTAEPTHTPDERIYGLADTWKVDGQWELTFDKVTVTEERNNYSGKNPEQVLIVDYTYKNIGYEHDVLDGLYFSFFVNSQIVDSTGLVGYDYSLEGLNSPKSVPVDATCKAQDSLGLDNKSSEVKIIMSQYDGNKVKRSATFVLPISEETATPSPTATATPTITPTPPI
jgi:HRD ubiquitin ligase complex, ER membrane component